MSSYDNRQFHMTIWPGVALPLPSLLKHRDRYELDATGLALIGTGGWQEVERAERQEIYLKLYAVDLNDPAGILSFARAYGTPSAALVQQALAGHRFFAGLFDEDEDRALLEHVHRHNPSLRERMDPSHPDWELIDIETLNSFRLAARVLGDLTDAWRITRLDPKFDISARHWRLPYNFGGDADADIRFRAMQLLTDGLTRLLSRFRPFIMATPVPEGEEDEEHEVIEATPGRGVHLEASPSITFAHLAEFCALELFDHIAGSEVYRICENENCSRIFVLQYGAQKHGMSKRQGVKYCSTYCAQAKAARAYRARRKAGLAKTRGESRAVQRRKP
jgi:hypothetical protein